MMAASRLVVALAVLPKIAALATAGRGFAQKVAPTPAPPPATPSPATLSPFLSWAESSGIKQLFPLEVNDFEGVRGVGATGTIPAGAAVLTVPSKLAIQINSLSKPPRNLGCDEDSWKACKWDARLAMLLLREKSDKRSELAPWLQQLPAAITTPLVCPALMSGLEKLGYTALTTAVEKQRTEWDAARGRAAGRPSAAEWDWAMSVVRSRAFSGPYTSGTLVGALAQLFLASTAALAYALVVGGAGASDQAFDGLLFALVFILSNEFVFGPRLSQAKRYVVCPWIDFLNHDGNMGASDVAYEYFTDGFTVRLDEGAGALEPGQQLFISYGDRSNDVLLQYYGFVEANNPHEVYTLDAPALVLALDEGGAIADGALAALKAQPGEAEALLQMPCAFRADGADENTLRLATRLAAAPSTSGEAPADKAAEAAARRALATVAEARLAALPVADTLDDGTEAGALLAAFVAEKQRVLRASANALASQAARGH